MKTVRLDPDLEQRLQRAAAAVGETLSEFIRRAAAKRAADVLDAATPADFADVIGAIHSGGGHARHTGTAFTEILTTGKHSE